MKNSSAFNSEVNAGDTLGGVSLQPSVAFESGEKAGEEPTQRRQICWEQYLAEVPALELPSDRPRPPELRPANGVESFSFGERLSHGIYQLSRETGIEAATFIFSAFSVLLHRYTAQHKFAVGASCGSGHLLPIVVDFSARPSFRDLLETLQNDCGMASQSEPVPSDIAERLGIEPDPSRHPIFQVGFANGMAASESVAGSLDLFLQLADDTRTGRLRYREELFDSITAARIVNHLQVLLDGALEDMNRTSAELPMLTEAELHLQLVEWNNTARSYPSLCLHQLVESSAAKHPNEIAVVYRHEQLTYAELNARANQVAHYLRKLGVSNHARVGICLQRSLEFAVALLGVLKAGAACVPLDPKYPAERLTLMLDDVAAPIVLTEPGLLQADVPVGTRVVHLSREGEAIEQGPNSNLSVGSVPLDLAYVIYTSGSTGKPRGVLLRHAGLANYTLAARDLYEVGPRDRMLQFCSISFDAAIEEIWTTWASGATLVFRGDDLSLEPSEFVSWLTTQQVTAVDLPTAYWHEWVHALPELAKKVPPHLRLVIVGGEKASREAFAVWHGTVGDRVRWVNTYGPAEASVCVTAYEPKLRPGDQPPPVLPIGRPFANTRVYLLDPDSNPVPVGVPGELHIGGIGVAQGYLNLPQLTKEKFVADMFSDNPSSRLYKTGDLARYLPNGDLEFVGRRDNQVKIRGFRVEPTEIESVLDKHPKVRESAVVLREDATGNKRLVAYIVKHEETATEGELRQYLQKCLPEYMVPSQFVFLPAMPLTPNGKVDRRALPVPDFDSPDSSMGSNDAVAADDLFQAQLIQIWEKVLGRKPVGLRDNFFDLGGHSLLAVRLMNRIKQLTGTTIPLAVLLEAPTVEQLAVALRNGCAHRWDSLVPIQPEGSRPPFFCVHGVGGNVVGFHYLAKYMKPDYPFYGLQAQGMDGSHSDTRIEDMAAHYINAIRAVQARGPYQLGGFSLGGLVAYEMACQLVAAGEEVGAVILFDTYATKPKPVNASLLELARHPSWAKIKRLPEAIYKKIRRTVRVWFLPDHVTKVRLNNDRAAEQYRLRPYSGKITLLRAEDTWRTSEDPEAGWGPLVGEVESVQLSGGHIDILGEPHVGRLAECLKDCINRASLEKPEVLAAD